MSKDIRDENLPEELKEAEALDVGQADGAKDNLEPVKKQTVIKAKQPVVEDEHLEDDEDELEGPVKEETFSKSIKKKVRATGLSAYFVLTVRQMGAFFKNNKKRMTVFYSIVSAIVCVLLALLVTFTFVYSGVRSDLDKKNDELARLDNLLKQENIKYFNDILKNPSIFNVIDKGTYVENNFIDYSITVTYNGNTTVKYTSIDKNQIGLSIETTGGDSVRIQLVESYTDLGRRYLGTNLLRYFSSFINQLPTVGENGETKYEMKDYRTFFSIGQPANLPYLDEEGHPTYTITAEMSESENVYTIDLYNFNHTGNRKEIDIYFNKDISISNDQKKANYVALTKDEPMEIVSRKEIHDEDNVLVSYELSSLAYNTLDENGDNIKIKYLLPLADNTAAERTLLLSYLNSFDGAGYTDSDLDTYKPIKRRAIDKEPLNIVERELTREHMSAVVDSALTIMQSLGAEQRYFLQTLLSDSPTDLNKFGKYPVTLLTNLFDSLSFVSKSDFEYIYNNLTDDTIYNKGTASTADKANYNKYQAADLLYRTFGVDYRLSDAEKTTAGEIVAKVTAKDYTFTTAQKQLMQKLLGYTDNQNNYVEGIYENETVYNICSALYTLKAQLKPFSFSKHMNLTVVSVATNIG